MMSQFDNLESIANDDTRSPADREAAMLDLAKSQDSNRRSLFVKLAEDREVVVRWSARWVLFVKFRDDTWVDRIMGDLGAHRDFHDHEVEDWQSVFERLRAAELLTSRALFEPDWSVRRKVILELCRKLRRVDSPSIVSACYECVLRIVGRYRPWEPIEDEELAHIDESVVQEAEGRFAM